jgi:hypothetical protein
VFVQIEKKKKKEKDRKLIMLLTLMQPSCSPNEQSKIFLRVLWGMTIVSASIGGDRHTPRGLFYPWISMDFKTVR